VSAPWAKLMDLQWKVADLEELLDIEARPVHPRSAASAPPAYSCEQWRRALLARVRAVEVTLCCVYDPRICPGVSLAFLEMPGLMSETPLKCVTSISSASSHLTTGQLPLRRRCCSGSDINPDWGRRAPPGGPQRSLRPP
jgi:hypothetical protein